MAMPLGVVPRALPDPPQLAPFEKYVVVTYNKELLLAKVANCSNSDGTLMNKDATNVKHDKAAGLDSLDAHRDINRIADAIVHRSITTEELLTSECLEVAHEHYVEIIEVYKRLWQKVSQSPDLHPTHPAGKTDAYYTLRERAEHIE
jgi:hypothetical protein